MNTELDNEATEEPELEAPPHFVLEIQSMAVSTKTVTPDVED